jgi:glycosyltransferase involved in cell wall biosynthesis
LFPEKDFKLIKQSGNGKGNAVREGFEIATGEIFMILDADISVPPETLLLFYDAIVDNKGDFINGVRLVYPLEKNSMKFANMVANKFFGCAFTWLLDQPIRDTLCGTKVLRSSDYQRILSGRKFFGDFDPFGDFDLLFGAAKLNMKIIGLPIRYQARSYGDTNIHRWIHGIVLFRMMLFAAKKIKFYN